MLIYNKKFSVSPITTHLPVKDITKNINKKIIIKKITTINISSGVQGISMKTDGGWKDNLSRIADAHPTSELAQQHRKRSIKEVKTQQVVEKHRKRQQGKK